MKRILFTLLIWTGFISLALSQENLSGYLFDSYKEAIVHFKGNLQSNERVNYNLLDGKLYFIDRQDNKIKVVSDVDKIAFVKVGDRSFLLDGDGMKEVVSTSPLIYAKYNAKGRKKPSKAAYGGTSQVSSSTSYAELRDGGSHAFLKSDEIEIHSHHNEYWIEKDGKKRKFTQFKQFIKIYSAHKEQLEQYIKDNNINFEDVKAIIELCRYAEGL
ncbi:hypothetical protein M2451_003905 [Dysgonomonas sp. PFB1-18]|uniref:hypothetical protein n=1 Tax=unclassified Dysgonomonas TaxID=2630389 RepID=UPI0024768AC1|nr:MULTISPECIES: hypothetical protein [unclassified Dysgonomonas]MDH6311016.1 hypothetical protein [Dysgonomonas sp. PF1-14]MDH6337865.1 hypothetical protein [Dysgonomonas sp. PF1-16]MDH6382564.1 hypothetical protein [Dysgonomonas sp. PFB1-18]MDH6397997.1 hypothetical protein [Dysgonomonas sp. PF1-23]